jgi:hypothetical protein
VRRSAVYPPLQNRKAADVAQQANVTVCFAPLAAAEIEDAEAADGEVVADGIGGISLLWSVP